MWTEGGFFELLASAVLLNRTWFFLPTKKQSQITDTGLDKAKAGIKIAGRNLNNLRNADDTTLIAESEEEQKSLLMKLKRRVKKLS